MDRLLLYWTSEPSKRDALMVLPYDAGRVEEAGRHFDETVRRIQAREFEVRKAPEPAICKECDLRPLCEEDGTVRSAEKAGTRKLQDSELLPGAPDRPAARVRR